MAGESKVGTVREYLTEEFGSGEVTVEPEAAGMVFRVTVGRSRYVLTVVREFLASHDATDIRGLLGRCEDKGMITKKNIALAFLFIAAVAAITASVRRMPVARAQSPRPVSAKSTKAILDRVDQIEAASEKAYTYKVSTSIFPVGKAPFHTMDQIFTSDGTRHASARLMYRDPDGLLTEVHREVVTKEGRQTYSDLVHLKSTITNSRAWDTARMNGAIDPDTKCQNRVVSGGPVYAKAGEPKEEILHGLKTYRFDFAQPDYNISSWLAPQLGCVQVQGEARNPKTNALISKDELVSVSFSADESLFDSSPTYAETLPSELVFRTFSDGPLHQVIPADDQERIRHGKLLEDSRWSQQHGTN